MKKTTEQLGFNFDEAKTDNLLELPIDPQARGFSSFVSDREKGIAQINEKFGVMINHNVRLKLQGWEEEFVGKLLLNDLLLPKSKKDEVPLRIGRITFDVRDIEYCFSAES
jgi:hypothetical protein